MLTTKKEAFELLNKLNAPTHLKTHVTLVGEAADELILYLEVFKLELDIDFIDTGIVIHDIGKTIHVNEMVDKGSKHEPDGEKLLLKYGASDKLARVCMSHARWHEMACSLEELLIALSDKLWKGKRVRELEERVIDSIAKQKKIDKWEIFTELDTIFEKIAAGGYDRLKRSVI